MPEDSAAGEAAASEERMATQRPRVMVLTTVHHPDDTRIREKLVRSLGEDFTVDYATAVPGPRDPSGLTWHALRGRRVLRNLGAWRIGLTARFDVLSLHDPEMLPLGLVVRWIRRRPVVFDVHEDIPAQMRVKPWIPRVLRTPVAWVLHRMLRLAERSVTITLAEAGYGHLFRRDHPVFRNHPDPSTLPEPRGERRRRVIYVGDITEARGLREATAAAGVARLPLHLVGRVSAAERDVIGREAALAGTSVRFHGRVHHRLAMQLLGESAAAVSPLHDQPNYRHSAPTKILEYLAMGVPVVATDLPGTRSLVAGLDAVWLVPPGDVAAMAEALTAAADDDALRKALDQVPTVRRRFRWPADEVRSFYRGLLTG